MISPSLGFSSGRSSSEQRADARTAARTANRGGSNRVKVYGGTSEDTIPTWALLAGVVLVFLVIVALVLA